MEQTGPAPSPLAKDREAVDARAAVDGFPMEVDLHQRPVGTWLNAPMIAATPSTSLHSSVRLIPFGSTALSLDA